MNCPCGSKLAFSSCCAPYLNGDKVPATPEALMRSRYVAYTKGDIDYLRQTLAPDKRAEFRNEAAKQWAAAAEFTALTILKTAHGGPVDTAGTVEFIASYMQTGQAFDHHEVSRFRKYEDGRWYFVDGDSRVERRGVPLAKVTSAHVSRPGRNAPCQCGSGKKYKTCCGRTD